MVRYRRNRLAGGSYFFTVTLNDRGATTLVDHIHLLGEALRHTRRQRPFILDAVVVLPDHLHMIWTLPPGDHDFSTRWRAIKSRFTRAVLDAGTPLRRNRRGEYNLWQRRFWEHTLRDTGDRQRHLDYIHYNPVKHGYVSRPDGWPWSSLHRYQAAGYYPEDWGIGPLDFHDDVGHE